MDLNETNEIVQMILKKRQPGKDVKVCIKDCDYGGFWQWKGSFHERISLNTLNSRFSCFSELINYLKSIPLVRISDEEILNFKDPMQPF